MNVVFLKNKHAQSESQKFEYIRKVIEIEKISESDRKPSISFIIYFIHPRVSKLDFTNAIKKYSEEEVERIKSLTGEPLSLEYYISKEKPSKIIIKYLDTYKSDQPLSMIKQTRRARRILALENKFEELGYEIKNRLTKPKDLYSDKQKAMSAMHNLDFDKFNKLDLDNEWSFSSDGQIKRDFIYFLDDLTRIKTKEQLAGLWPSILKFAKLLKMENNQSLQEISQSMTKIRGKYEDVRDK